MAYFANGAEGGILDNQCEKCLYGMSDDILCPVSAVQTIYNYDQCDNEKLKEAMDILVDSKGTCKMRDAMKQAGLKFDTSHRNQMELGL
jgi:hypothetical protein